MADQCTDLDGTICKHVDDTLTRYVDFGPMLAPSETISSATATCADDSALVIGTVSVLSTNTTVPTRSGTRVITADEGIKFQLSAGTAIASTAEPVRIKVTATTSAGESLVRTARLRVME